MLEIDKTNAEASVGNRYYLVLPRPLVSRRTPSTWYLFLDFSHYPHPGGLMDPPARAWFISISWGHKVVWGFITIMYLCHALLFYLRLCVEHLYCFGSRHVFAVSTSPVTLSGSQSFTAVVANPGSVPEPANFVAGSLVGWPPEILYESCDFFVVMPR